MIRPNQISGKNLQIESVDLAILLFWLSGCVKENVEDVLPKIRFFLRQLYTILGPEAEYNGAESGAVVRL